MLASCRIREESAQIRRIADVERRSNPLKSRPLSGSRSLVKTNSLKSSFVAILPQVWARTAQILLRLLLACIVSQLTFLLALEAFLVSFMATSTESDSASVADDQALAELNQRSAGLGLWNVGIFHPAIHEWKYTTKATGQLKAGAAFRCTLVSLLDASQYVNAHMMMRSDNMTPLREAEAKFKPASSSVSAKWVSMVRPSRNFFTPR